MLSRISSLFAKVKERFVTHIISDMANYV